MVAKGKSVFAISKVVKNIRLPRIKAYISFRLAPTIVNMFNVNKIHLLGAVLKRPNNQGDVPSYFVSYYQDIVGLH